MISVVGVPRPLFMRIIRKTGRKKFHLGLGEECGYVWCMQLSTQ